TAATNLSLGAHRPTSVRPLVTDPHPTTTAKRTTTATTANSLAYHGYPTAPPAALATIAALRPDLSPATLALYAYSQRNASRPWWDPFGWNGYGPGYYGFGWAPYGFSPFGFGPWWPGYGYGSGFSIGFGYQTGPWAFGVNYGLGFG